MTQVAETPAVDQFVWFTPSREEWLRQAVVAMLPMLEEVKLSLDPSIVPVSVGFPKVSHGKGDAIGVCHVKGACPTDERLRPIFISPVLSNAVMDILPTLLHEMVHAALPPEAGHRKPFADAVKALGLAGKPTHTFLEPESNLHGQLAGIASELGHYPHVAMAQKRKPGTKKWVRMVSPEDPSYRVDILLDTLEEHGAPRDPWGNEMEVSNKAKNRAVIVGNQIISPVPFSSQKAG